ncbi:MAG: alpha/beta fold hydrolase [Candidatus Hydrogenedentota bacterium]
MKRLTVVALVIVSVFSLCPAYAATINTGRADVELVVPEGYSKDSPAPLVMLLHGYTSSGAGQESYMKFGELVDEYGFLLLMPDGTREERDSKNQFWNATDACCNFQGSDVDDSGYLQGLIDEVKKQYSIDANRVYLIGHSNGGFMSHRMAYDHPDTIAAIASLAGASLPDMKGASPKRPVNILQIHGTNDKTISYDGGTIGTSSYPSATETVELWAAYNGIGVENKKRARKKLDLDRRPEGKETTITRYDKKGSVELWTIQDGGHIPGITKDFSRNVIEWLMAHPKE